MSVHSSLSPKDKDKRSRSVLKRHERLKKMQEKEKWRIGDSVFGLPKLKRIRWKLKKAKKTEEETAAAEQGAAATEEKKTPPGKTKETKGEKK